MVVLLASFKDFTRLNARIIKSTKFLHKMHNKRKDIIHQLKEDRKGISHGKPVSHDKEILKDLQNLVTLEKNFLRKIEVPSRKLQENFLHDWAQIKDYLPEDLIHEYTSLSVLEFKEKIGISSRLLELFVSSIPNHKALLQKEQEYLDTKLPGTFCKILELWNQRLDFILKYSEIMDDIIGFEKELAKNHLIESKTTGLIFKGLIVVAGSALLKIYSDHVDLNGAIFGSLMGLTILTLCFGHNLRQEFKSINDEHHQLQEGLVAFQKISRSKKEPSFLGLKN